MSQNGSGARAASARGALSGFLALAMAALCSGLAHFGFAGPQASGEFAVGVGLKAPELEVGRWLKGSPVGPFEKGRIYVVESWATWCAPCIQSIPHLTDLQKKYAGRVTVVGVDIWEQDAALAEPFVAKQGARMDYSVAQDRVPPGKTFFDGKFAKSWIEGAGKYSVGIPLAYVVDGRGVIAWIGHPADLDGPLDRIVGGSWDLAGAKAQYDAEMKESSISEPFKVAYYASERSGDWKGAAEACASLLRLDPGKFADWAGRGFAALYSDGKMPGPALDFAKKAIRETYPSEPRVLAVLARGLARTGAAPDSPELNLAQEAADRAYRLVEGKKAFASGALARVLFARGDKEKAIALQRRALEQSSDPDEKDDMQSLLDFMLGKK